jgi:hypothetical protein
MLSSTMERLRPQHMERSRQSRRPSASYGSVFPVHCNGVLLLLPTGTESEMECTSRGCRWTTRRPAHEARRLIRRRPVMCRGKHFLLMPFLPGLATRIYSSHPPCFCRPGNWISLGPSDKGVVGLGWFQPIGLRTPSVS